MTGFHGTRVAFAVAACGLVVGCGSSSITTTLPPSRTPFAGPTVSCSPDPCNADGLYLRIREVNPNLPNQVAGNLVLPTDQQVVLSTLVDFTNQTAVSQDVAPSTVSIDTPDAEYPPVSGFAAPCSPWNSSIPLPTGTSITLDVCFAIDEYVPGQTSLIWTALGITWRITIPTAQPSPQASKSPLNLHPKTLQPSP